MSYGEKAIDRTPFIPGAGYVPKDSLKGLSVDLSLRQDLYFSPPTITPDNIKKFRDSLRQRPGVRQIHYGIYDDPKDYQDLVHGNKTADSDHVPDCIKSSYLDGGKYFLNRLAESHYASNQREPLGKSIVRNYIFPEEVKDPKFRFGVPTDLSQNAKELMYNQGLLTEPNEVKKLYYKTHGVTDPGQVSKRYPEGDIDLDNRVFGKKFDFESDGVKKSLMTDNLINPYPQTILADKHQEDFRQATRNLLGKGKYLGTLNPKFIDDDHTFGKNFRGDDEWNAERCIHGDSKTRKSKDLQADVDLGKDSHFASRIKKGLPSIRDQNRRYGVPTIRNDLVPPKKFKGVLNKIDYGDEPDAFDLLYPHPENIRGVGDEEFDQLMTKEEIFALMKKYDFNINEDEYDVMYEVGLKNYPNAEGKMSAKSFISTMRNLKREYQKYRGLFTSC